MAFAAGFNVGPKTLGVNFTAIHTTPQHPVGTICYDSKGREWLYIKAGGTIGAFHFCKATHADDPFTTVVIATASNAATKVLGMTTQALASGDYAWIVKRGVVEDDATLTGALAAGSPMISDASGHCVIAVETDINNSVGICLVDDGDNTGTVLLDC